MPVHASKRNHSSTQREGRSRPRTALSSVEPLASVNVGEFGACGRG
jgi:hypothetical protein